MINPQAIKELWEDPISKSYYQQPIEQPVEAPDVMNDYADDFDDSKVNSLFRINQDLLNEEVYDVWFFFAWLGYRR